MCIISKDRARNNYLNSVECSAHSVEFVTTYSVIGRFWGRTVQHDAGHDIEIYMSYKNEYKQIVCLPARDSKSSCLFIISTWSSGSHTQPEDYLGLGYALLICYWAQGSRGEGSYPVSTWRWFVAVLYVTDTSCCKAPEICCRMPMIPITGTDATKQRMSAINGWRLISTV